MSWRKSSYSNSDGGECVEVSDELVDAHQWRKSSYSNQDGGACLEVADEPAAALVPVRDSKNPSAPSSPSAPPAGPRSSAPLRRAPSASDLSRLVQIMQARLIDSARAVTL